jgi:hypothetical protein
MRVRICEHGWRGRYIQQCGASCITQAFQDVYDCKIRWICCHVSVLQHFSAGWASSGIRRLIMKDLHSTMFLVVFMTSLFP